MRVILQGRIITTTLQVQEDRFKVKRGCSPNGALYPFLWVLLMGDFRPTLSLHEVEPQCDADDLVIVIKGRSNIAALFDHIGNN